MRRVFVLSMLLIALALPLAAQEQAAPEMIYCCNGTGGMIHISAEVCPDGWRVCTPAPTVVPTAVPTPAPFEPKEVEVPSVVEWLLDMAASWYGKVIVLPAGLGILLSYLSTLLTAWIPKLRGRWAFVAVTASSTIATLIAVASDGQLDKNEYAVVVVALLAIPFAIAGYHLKGKK